MQIENACKESNRYCMFQMYRNKVIRNASICLLKFLKEIGCVAKIYAHPPPTEMCFLIFNKVSYSNFSLQILDSNLAFLSSHQSSGLNTEVGAQIDSSFILIALAATEAYRQSWPLLHDSVVGIMPGPLTLPGCCLLSC